MTPDHSTVVSAIVSDSAGVDDLTGGTLIDSTSGTTYGSFGTPGGQGSFTYTLTWAALNEVTAINFGAGGSARTVTARFFDNQGRRVSQNLSVPLTCDSAAYAACAGTCVDEQTDSSNCGSCGAACLAENATCIGGLCVDQVSEGDGDGFSPTTCDEICTDHGATCIAQSPAGNAYYADDSAMVIATCSDLPPANDSAEAYLDEEVCDCHQ